MFHGDNIKQLLQNIQLDVKKLLTSNVLKYTFTRLKFLAITLIYAQKKSLVSTYTVCNDFVRQS